LPGVSKRSFEEINRLKIEKSNFLVKSTEFKFPKYNEFLKDHNNSNLKNLAGFKFPDDYDHP